MNDFEKTLKSKLNEQIDAELGRQVPAPPFTPTSTTTAARRSAKRWTLPLLAAACVLVVAGGTAGAVHLLGENKHTVAPPATNAPTPKTSTSPSPADPSRTVVQLAGAAISLPRGWEARDYNQYLQDGSAYIYKQAWCLAPKSTPVVLQGNGHPDNCTLVLGTIADNGNPIDVDIEGGYSADPHPCGQPTRPVSEEQSGDRVLGGRSADWRRFRWDCQSGTKQYEQYVVATRPGFILISVDANAAMHDVMTGIAANSQLPAETSPLRYMDRGYLRSAQAMADGEHITLDRAVWREDGGVTNTDPAVYEYTIPTKLWDQADSSGNVGKPPAVGSLVYLQSNGTRITFFGVVLR